MARGKMGAVLMLAGGALVLGGWLFVGHEQAGQATAVPTAAAAVARAGTEQALLAPASGPQGSSPRSPEAFGRWLASQSSLRGTELDGSWDIDGQGVLHPTIALRRRFDHLLTLAGEAKVEEMTGFIGQQVRELGGPAAANAVLDAWQRYLALQRHAYQTRLNPRDRQSLMNAMAERQQVRRQVLGPELAAAFFSEDEAQLQALLQRAPGAAAPELRVLGTRIDRSTLDAAALARLQKEEAAWADWQRRLALARRQVDGLKAAPELSAPQRQQAIEQVLAGLFDAKEAVRARALLQLSSPLSISTP